MEHAYIHLLFLCDPTGSSPVNMFTVYIILSNFKIFQVNMPDEYQVQIWFADVDMFRKQIVILNQILDDKLYFYIKLPHLGENVFCIIMYNISPVTTMLVNYSLHCTTTFPFCFFYVLVPVCMYVLCYTALAY